ncbi:hypothetical protein [Flavobacterium sp.]|uniref:hypothetical protein n=1 Tax=Flavobacterium sp. TaxID=239 RepID=UPI00261FB1AD|nr:hypothetical protein [Flavobacterium sp.]
MKIKYLIFILTFLTILSCKKNIEKKIVHKKKINIENKIKYQVLFPDTIIKNRSYNGVIKFKSSLDTIATSFDDKSKIRYAIFYLKQANKIESDQNLLKKNAKEFGADNNNQISFSDIKFNSCGLFYIDGIVSDFVIIDLKKRDENGKKMVRYIENEVRVIRKVVVIDEPKNK